MIGSKSKKRFKKRWNDFYGMHCAYCTIDCSEISTIDHVVPISKGGSNKRENLVLACLNCNVKKGSKSLSEFGKLILKPLERNYV